MRLTLFLTAAIGLAEALPRLVAAGPFIDTVVEVSYGNYAGYGQDQFPDVIFGPPEGTGAMGGSNDVLSLGDGGSITVAFSDGLVLDGAGPDFTIFENPFYVGGDPLDVFAEVAIVEVSQDGSNFVKFPCDYDPSGEPINNPTHWHGFSGVNPVYSNSTNGLDPTDPEVSGGDQFDLATVGLSWIQYIRITDTNEDDLAMHDDDGDVIYDPGRTIAMKSGFDLDAIAAVNWLGFTPTPFAATPTPIATPQESPFPTQTSTPSATAVLTLTPTPLPSPTPDGPAAYEVVLDLNQTAYTSGDQFRFQALWANPSVPTEVIAFIVLDVHGCYWYWPTWSTELTGKTLNLGGRTWTQELVLDFLWPENVGADQDLRFWAVMVRPSAPEVPLGNVATISFDFY